MKKYTLLLFIFVSLFSLISCSTTVETTDIPDMEIEQISNNIVKLKANKKRGYNYDAYIMLPNTFSEKQSNHLLVIPNNTGHSNSIEVHDKAVLNAMRSNWEGTIAKRINAPLLMPVFPRNEIYYHALTFDAITSLGKNKRIDLQLIAMIKDALVYLEKTLNKEFQNKILMVGASASGDFVSRFTILHPEYVHATVSSLNAGIPMLPIARFKGHNITYPFGISNIKRISKSNFNEDEFKKVKILSMNGLLDNDKTNYLQGKNIAPYTREEVMNIFGDSITKRSETSGKIYMENTENCQIILYKDFGHQMVIDDAVKFLEQNQGEEFIPIDTIHKTVINMYH